EHLHTIKTLITAGEEAPIAKAKAFSKKGTYINAYGPTETSICATVFDGKIEEKVSIGKPIANTRVYILSDDLQLQPLSVVGELCVSGVGVARGYVNKPGLTSERFILDPFISGGRMYRTGDLARWLPDGNLEFLGRKDAQVKIHGYRIELGEVENALSCFPSITQCCVLSKQGVNGVNRLVGYVVVEGDLDKEELQEHLKLSLPEYMVPMIWVEMEVMPLTSNGKLDRKSLPDPDSSELSTKIYVAPRTTTEVQLVEIWQDLLGLENIGIHDNFFELGGHSLLATRLVSKIRKELSIEIEIADVFEHTTVSTLGTYLSVQSEGVLLPTIVVQDRP
ncbi:non-ribosomal peptide synthetase, partial [Aquimarina celericrescens]|nr:non-ribosomal peptide synthetase [Aquimarina celericrescens]